MRPADAAVPDDERLCRSYAPAHLAGDGEHLLHDAIDLPSTSCNRARHAPLESVRVPGRPEDTGIAWMCAGDLPPGGVDPEDGGHCGIVHACSAAPIRVASGEAR